MAQDTENGGEAHGVAVAPEKTALIGDGDVGVLAGDAAVQQRLFEGNGQTGQDAVPVDALTGDTIQAFGDIGAADLQFRMAAGFHMDARGGFAENFLGEFVAVARDAEDDVVAVEGGVVDGGDAVTVGPETDGVAGRAELYEGNAAAGF